MPDRQSACAPHRGCDSRLAWARMIDLPMLQARRPDSGHTSGRRSRAGCRASPAFGQMGSLDQADDFQFLRSRISHSSPSPSAIMLFLSRRNSRACSATTSFSARASCRRSQTSLLVAARAVSPPASTCQLQGTLSTSCNTGFRRYPRADTAPQCCAHREARLVFATAIARVTETAAYSSRARRGPRGPTTTKAETALNSSASDDRPLCARSRRSHCRRRQRKACPLSTAAIAWLDPIGR